MQYLIEQPTSMPLREAGMAYLAADASDTLRLVSSNDVRVNLGDEIQAVAASA